MTINKAICITFGEQSENHVGMNINGKGLASSGFSVAELEKIAENLVLKEVESELTFLDSVLKDGELRFIP